MTHITLVIATLIAASSIVSAQTPTADQQRAAVRAIAAVGQFAWIDTAEVNAGAVDVFGWGFECAAGSPGNISLEIDGKAIVGATLRSARGDVWQWATVNGICSKANTPWFSGVEILVLLDGVKPGPHTAQFVIRNANGVTSRSNPVAFIKPASDR